jgi:hypothetical protein
VSYRGRITGGVVRATGLKTSGSLMWKYYKDTVDWLFHLDSQEWFLAMCAALVIGFFALRGFGSRSNY